MTPNGETGSIRALAKRRDYAAPLTLAARARVVTRLVAIVAGTSALAVTWFVALPFLARFPNARRAWRGRIFRAWARWCLARMRIDLDVRGEPPQAPCLLVANHTGYVDVLVLAAVCEHPMFVSNDDVRHYPFIGAMAHSFGTVFIARERKRELPSIDREMSRCLAAGYTVILFPEGTNSRGDAVQPFRPALLEPAVREGRSVAHATTLYATDAPDPPPSQAVCWVDTPMVEHAIKLLALARVRAKLVFGAELVRASGRKELAAVLHDRVARSFEPLD